MSWALRGLMMKVLSLCPGGRALGGFVKRHLTRDVPVNDDLFARKVEIAAENWQAFRRHAPDVWELSARHTATS